MRSTFPIDRRVGILDCNPYRKFHADVSSAYKISRELILFPTTAPMKVIQQVAEAYKESACERQRIIGSSDIMNKNSKGRNFAGEQQH